MIQRLTLPGPTDDRAGAGGSGPVAPREGQHGSGQTADFTPFDVEGASEEEKLGELRRRVPAGDRATVTAIWHSFADVPGVARAHPDLYAASTRLVPDLLDLFPEIAEAFKRAVEQRALDHLVENRGYVAAEMERLGVAQQAGQSSPAQHDALEQTKHMAELTRRALEAERRLLRVPVGYAPEHQGGAEGSGGAPFVFFSPDGGPKPGGARPEDGFALWEDVNREWIAVQAALAHLRAQSPALFALIEHAGPRIGAAEEKAAEVAGASDEAAAAMLDQSLRDLMTRLETVSQGIGSEYKWNHLGPVQEQVLEAPPFTQPIEGAIARHLIEHEKDKQMAKNMAIGIGGMIALLVAPFTAPKLAAALAAGPAVGGAAVAVGDAVDLNRVSKLRGAAAGRKEHDLVTKEALDEAALALVLDAAFAFLDARDALKALGGVKGVAERLARWAELAAGEAEEAFGAAIQGMGPAKALDAVGGLGAVEARLGAGSPSVRAARGYSDDVLHDLAEHLGAGEARAEAARLTGARPGASAEPPAGELLPRARKHVAARTGLPEERALDVVCPGARTEEELEALRRAGKSSAEAPSAEWARLATPEARMEAIHARALEWADAHGLPHPKCAIAEDGPYFDQTTWTIVYNKANLELSNDLATNKVWEFSQAIGIHELRHAHQFIESARIIAGETGGNFAAAAGPPLKLHPFAVRAAEKRGVLVAGMPGYDEARAWKESFAGTGARDRNVVLIELGEHREVLRKWAAARERRRAAMNELRAATEAGRPDAEVARLRAEWEAARAEERLQSARVDGKERERLANDAKYKALVEEADAYRVQEEYEALLAARREGRTPLTPTRTVDVGAPATPEPIRPDPIRDVGGPADDLDGTHVDSVHDLDDPTHVDSVHDVELPTDSEPPRIRR